MRKPEPVSLQLRGPSYLGFGTDNPSQKRDTLVVIFLRGAADGLHMVIPHAERAYHQLRPSLGLPDPDDPRHPLDERVIDLDGYFGFHPALRRLLPAWQDGQLACVHACGAPDESRSHFKAMELVERGTDQESGPTTGWIGRHLASLEGGSPSPLRVVSLGESIPRSLYGPVPAAPLRSLAEYQLGNSRESQILSAALSVLYQGDDSLAHQGQETLEILQTLGKLDPTQNLSDTDSYPDSDFGRGLAQIASLVELEIGLEAAAIDLGGWDTHFAQGVLEGQMPRLMEDLAGGLAAFHANLAAKLDNITLVVMTEFGRRAYENASLGTDHGHGGLMLLLGGSVAGGQVISRWPGLEESQLVGPGDLAATIDYRDILGEVLQKRLLTPDLAGVFPDHTPEFLGVISEH